MGALLSRLPGRRGGDIYTTAERALAGLDADIRAAEGRAARRAARAASLGAAARLYAASAWAAAVLLAVWALNRPPGELSPRAHAACVAPVFAVPLLAAAVLAAGRRVGSAVAARDAAALAAARARLGRAVADLKDATRYARTAALLAKYDPETRDAAARAAAAVQQQAQQQQRRHQQHHHHQQQRGAPPAAAAAVATAAGGAARALGAALGPALDALAAATVGDNPSLTALLAAARTEAGAARAAADALAADNARLRAALREAGVPGEWQEEVEEEEVEVGDPSPPSPSPPPPPPALPLPASDTAASPAAARPSAATLVHRRNRRSGQSDTDADDGAGEGDRA
jgi:hypothetical protein